MVYINKSDNNKYIESNEKVFLLAALVLACTAGSNASAMNEAALNASMSEMMPVKKTAKKTTKKTSKNQEDYDQEDFYKENNFCSI